MLIAGAALIAPLALPPTPVAAPALPQDVAIGQSVARYGQPIGPAATAVAVVTIGPPAPAPAVVTVGQVAQAAPLVLTHDGVSDRDTWAKEAAALRRAASVKVVPETAVKAVPETAVKAVPETAVKVVPETPEALKAPIARAAAEYGIPSDVLSAALARESGNFKPKYVYGYHLDGTGRGVAGIDKKSHPEITDQQAFSPDFAVDWMGQYLGRILKKNGGDVYSALREYNGGLNYASDAPGYQGHSISELTRNHADAIMAHAARAVLG